MTDKGQDNLIKAGGIIAVLGTGFFIFKNLTKATPKKGKDDDTNTAAKSEAARLIAAGQKLTYPPSQYVMFADSLRNAMFDVGTDWDAIEGIINKLNNNLDFLALYTAFGVRPYYFFGFKLGDWNLSAWLTEEFSPGNVSDFNKLLASRHITYRL